MMNLDSPEQVDYEKIEKLRSLLGEMNRTEFIFSLPHFMLGVYREYHVESPFLCFPDSVEVQCVTPNYLFGPFLMRIRLRADPKRVVSLVMGHDLLSGDSHWEIYNISEPLLPDDYPEPIKFDLGESEKLVPVIVKMLNGEITAEWFE